MCAWDLHSYGGTKELDSGAGVGSRNVGVVEKNAIGSGKNFTTHQWCGVNEHTFLPDETVWIWYSGDAVDNLGDYGHDNQIDHFDVVAQGGNCPA